MGTLEGNAACLRQLESALALAKRGIGHSMRCGQGQGAGNAPKSRWQDAAEACLHGGYPVAVDTLANKKGKVMSGMVEMTTSAAP